MFIGGFYEMSFNVYIGYNVVFIGKLRNLKDFNWKILRGNRFMIRGKSRGCGN